MEESEEKKDKSAAEMRKINKPLMEKKRRERINNCLNQLKMFLMDATKKDSSYYSKLEKADILEMTVKYLKNLQRQHMAVAMATDPKVVSKYAAGYSQCATEVSRYLGKLDGFSPDVRNRLVNHLSGCVHKIAPPPPPSSTITCGGGGDALGLHQPQQTLAFQFPSISTHQQEQPLDLALGQVPSVQAQTMPSLGGAGTTLLVNNPTPSVANISNVPVMPIQLIPAKLPSGDTVYILANTQALSTTSLVSAPRVPTATITSLSSVMSAPPISPPSPLTLSAPSTSIAIVPPQIQTSGLACLSSPPLPSPEVQIIKPVSPPGLQFFTNMNTPVFPRPTPVIEHRVEPEVPQESRSPEVRAHVRAARPQEVPLLAAPPVPDHNNNHQVALAPAAEDQLALGPMWRPW